MSDAPEPISDRPASLPAVDRVGEVIGELRRLLAIPPDVRPSDWQNAVGAMISVLVGDFSSQENHDAALITITLVALAAQKGSKDAKKRTLKPTRWITTAPTSISKVFSAIDEARSAIRVLQPLRTDWIEGYICRELATNKWPALSPSLVEWLLKTTPSLEAFIRALNREATQAPDGPKAWIPQTIEIAAKLIGKFPVPAGNGMMSEVAELISLLDPLPKPIPNSENINVPQKGRAAFLSLLTQVTATEPSVLVQGAVSVMLAKISPPSSAKKTPPTHEIELLCRRTISVLAVLLPNADQAMRAHYRNIWSAYRALHAKADQLIKNEARMYPVLSLLTTPPDDSPTSADFSVTAGLESVLCELIVNWDDYFQLHSADPAAQQLSARIDQLSSHLGVIRFGNVGQETPFDPVRHHLADSSLLPSSKVTILKPGIALVRSDGTSRVLLMAAALPCMT